MVPGSQDRVVLVTGGASGLGRRTAELFASAGATVIVADRSEREGDEAADLIRRAGYRAVFMRCDVSDESSVEALSERISSTFGRLDCAVNNAAVEGVSAKVADYPADDWNRTIAVNLTGVFLCMRFEIRRMLEAKAGSIVNVSSTVGLGSHLSMPAYTASKHGLIGLTKSAAVAYAPSGIRVNVICPGSFRTPMSERIYGDGIDDAISSVTPMGRPGNLSEIAESILWLCSPSASFVTGAVLSVDGGKRAI